MKHKLRGYENTIKKMRGRKKNALTVNVAAANLRNIISSIYKYSNDLRGPFHHPSKLSSDEEKTRR